jgi:hypothetical protein
MVEGRTSRAEGTRIYDMRFKIYEPFLVVGQFALPVGRAPSRAGLGAPKRSGGGSSVASPHPIVHYRHFDHVAQRVNRE